MCSPYRVTMPESTGDMKLYWSSRSPFVRKVMVAAHEVGIADRIRTQRVVVAPNNPNIEVMQDNPLGKIPTLVLDDGTSLYDSRVICEYFDTLHDGPRLFPTSPDLRWKTLRRQALGDGLMEVIVLRLGEMNRPLEAQSEKHLAAFLLKAAKILDQLEAEADGPSGALSIGDIAVGCALAHLDFRFSADDWRAGRTNLAAWHADFARRPSVCATQFANVY
jgi:glutathione S-transferase